MAVQNTIYDVPLDMVQPERRWIDRRAVGPEKNRAGGKANEQRMPHDGG